MKRSDLTPGTIYAVGGNYRRPMLLLSADRWYSPTRTSYGFRGPATVRFRRDDKKTTVTVLFAALQGRDFTDAEAWWEATGRDAVAAFGESVTQADVTALQLPESVSLTVASLSTIRSTWEEEERAEVARRAALAEARALREQREREETAEQSRALFAADRLRAALNRNTGIGTHGQRVTITAEVAALIADRITHS